ncbi:dCTP deaminase [Lentzea sp. NBRC 105346]|uniref:dCTP deaminase n=1 Tax=Lentzea sp. NBRC 105346 TaxID=3032205 RepID=UPI00331AA071
MLTDHDIHRALNKGDLVVDPFSADMVRPAALSLRLGQEAYTLVPTGPVDTARHDTYPSLLAKELDDHGRLAIGPGEVVLAATLERIAISTRLVGVLDGISDLARLGISVVLSSQVSPGFGAGEGAIITLEIVSRLQETVHLHPGTRICNLMLFKASRSALRSYTEMPHNYSRDVVISPSRLADHHV